MNRIDYNKGFKTGLKAASAMLGVTSDEIRLAAGEISAAEMRKVKAVLEWRKAAIRERK
jgi:hypothetical protein